MKKVTAYKANNGRIFEDEGKCIEYERKLSMYPKVYRNEIKNDNLDIICIEEITQEKPYSTKQRNVYFIVAGKYKFYDNYHNNLLNLKSIDIKGIYKYFLNIDIAVAIEILKGNKLTDKLANDIANRFHLEETTGCYSKMICKIIEPNRKWLFEDERWHYGQIAMNTLIVEKL